MREADKKKFQEITRMRNEVGEKNKEILNTKIDPMYYEIAGKIEKGLENDKYLPHILERLLTIEQAKMVNELPDQYREESAGRLEVSEEFAKKVGMDKKTADKYLKELYEKGFIYPTRGGPQLPRAAMQFKNAAVNNPKYEESLGQEYLDLWTAFELDEVNLEAAAKRLVMDGIPRMRVLPRWRAIKNIPGIMPCEDVREWIKLGAEKGPIAIYYCPCKKFSSGKTCDIDNDCCLGFTGMAQYHIARGTGREVTVKEALDLFEKFDKLPALHMSQNIRGNFDDRELPIGILCQCHWDCCVVLHPVFGQDKYTIEQMVAKSRFEAIVDPEKCIGCKTCLEICQWGGAQMKYYPEYGEERAYVDTEACFGCGSCVINCPTGAREMKLVRPPEHIPEMREESGVR